MARQTFTHNFLVLGRFGVWNRGSSIATLSADFFEGNSGATISTLRFQPNNQVRFEISPRRTFENPGDLSFTITDLADNETFELHPVSVGTFTVSSEDRADYNRIIGRYFTGASAGAEFTILVSNDSRTPPIEVSASTGAPAAAASLNASNIFVSAATGAPAATANARVAGMVPVGGSVSHTATSALRPPRMGVDAATGSPATSINISDPARIFLSIATGEPEVAALLAASAMAAAAQTGVPNAIARMYPKLELLLRHGAYTATASLEASELFPAQIATGAPAVVADVLEPTGILSPPLFTAASAEANLRPGFLTVDAETGIIEASARTVAPVVELSVSTGAPLVRAEISQFMRVDAATEAIRAFVQLASGATDAVFRYLPDTTITRREIVSFQIPEVTYPVEGGTYRVTGLPTGLTFDSDTLVVSGSTNVPAGNYQVFVEYVEP